MTRPLTLALVTLSALPTLALTAATPALAQIAASSSNLNWSAAGSTGIVDESSAGLVTLDGAAASIRPTAPAQTVAVLRYPVTSVLPYGANLNLGTVFFRTYTIALTFQKNDEQAYAAATLKRVRLSDGFTTSMSGVSSLGTLPGPVPQVLARTFNCTEACFDPISFAYYVEVVLWKPLATSDPRALGLRITQFAQ